MNVDKVDSYFGEGTSLKGSLKFKGLLRFDGVFEGDIQSEDTFIVGETGSVKANIKTGNLYNFGTIVGDIAASNRISLHAHSSLEGNIRSPIFITEELAFFQGSCTMPSPMEGLVKTPPPGSMTGAAPRSPKAPLPVDAATGGEKVGTGRLATILGALLAAAMVIGWYQIGGQTAPIEPTKPMRHPAAAVPAATVSGAAPVESLEQLREKGGRAFADGEFKRAMNVFARVVETSGDDAYALKMLGASAAKAGNRDAAIDAYEKLAALKPDLDGLKALAVLYEKTKNEEKLLSTLKTMSAMAPRDKKLAAQVRELTAAREAQTDPVKRLQAQIKRKPGVAGLRLKLADELLSRKQYNKTVETLQAAVKAFPNSKDLRARLARMLNHTGKEKEALGQYRILARSAPNTIEASNNAAYEKLNTGSLDDAAVRFQKILEEAPGNHRARLGLAMVYSKREENEKAAVECRKILDRTSDYAPAMNRLAWIYAKQGVNLGQAEKLSKNSMAVFPDIPEYIDTLSEINFKKANYDEAIRLIKKAVQLVPDDPYYKRQLFKFQRAKRQSG